MVGGGTIIEVKRQVRQSERPMALRCAMAWPNWVSADEAEGLWETQKKALVKKRIWRTTELQAMHEEARYTTRHCASPPSSRSNSSIRRNNGSTSPSRRPLR